MFSKLRVGARKVGGRNKERPASRDGTDGKSPSTTSNGHHALALPDARILEERPDTSDSTRSVVAASAPVLPPIPRVASKVDRGENVPDIPTIRTVGVMSQEHDGASSSPSPSPNDAEAEHDAGHPLEPVSSIDRAKAGLRADKDQMDAMLMPPPSLRPTRPQMKMSRHQPRAWTDLNTQSGYSRTNERPISSRGSSTINEIPTPYRLDEPKEYIMPSQSHDVDSSSQSRPKSRLTRLNPLSYLSRKRSSQMGVEGVDNSALMKRASFTPYQDLSKSFDPRIIGEKVHDFSAPQPSQYMSIQDLRSLAAELPPAGLYSDPRRGSDSNLPMRRNGDPSPERRHLPVFKEDFSDSAEGWRLDPEDRRNRTSTNIVDKVAALEKAADKEEKRKSSLPAFAQNMPEDLPASDPGDVLQTPPSAKVSPRPPVEQDFSLTPNSIQQTPDSLKPPKETPKMEVSPGASPLTDRSQAASPETPQTLSSLPRHMRSKTASVKSQASRFSFDNMVGSGSAAQEKMLEERHRQRAAQRVRAASMTGASINEEDDFDEDDIDFDDGLEEEIPGMNDDDDYGFSRQGVANMTLDANENTPSRRNIENTDDGEEMIGLYDEDDGDDDDEFGTAGLGGGGFGNMTLESIKANDTPITASKHMPKSSDDSVQGLGLQTDLASSSKDAPDIILTPVSPTKEADNDLSPLRDLKNRVDEDINDLNNDGFYFDDGEFDGEFDDEDLIQGEQFDEDILDGDFARGKPLPTLKVQDTAALQDGSSPPSTKPASLGSVPLVDRHQPGLAADMNSTSMQARRSSAYGQHSDREAAVGLTQENLTAYHNALAYATNQAALQGRFDRKTSGQSTNPDSVNDDKQLVQQNSPPGISNQFSPRNPDDDFDFDDSLDDDAIIAAANAEALENDDDGFYGQEFGFYAFANGSDEIQSYHGGFFGPAGSGQVKRSHSGRADFQEPSLTPITERSEWSNRNSMISMAMHPPSGISPSGVPMSAPGLAQLADQMQQDGSMEDMSLGALMRARRTAFGGSSTSLPSMGASGSRSGSPSRYMLPQGNPSLNANHAYPPPVPEEGLAMQQSHSSLGLSSMANPILSLQTQNLSLRPTTSSADSSPLKRASVGRPGHSRNSSSAESVSYQMEMDEDGGNQWVIERRRTLDNGETEVLGRELVKGTL